MRISSTSSAARRRYGARFSADSPSSASAPSFRSAFSFPVATTFDDTDCGRLAGFFAIGCALGGEGGAPFAPPGIPPIAKLPVAWLAVTGAGDADFARPPADALERCRFASLTTASIAPASNMSQPAGASTGCVTFTFDPPRFTTSVLSTATNAVKRQSTPNFSDTSRIRGASDVSPIV